MSTRTSTASGPRTGSSGLDAFFKISQRGSTVGREVRGGLVTFFAMAYIVVLNSFILNTKPDVSGHFIGGGTTPDTAKVAAMTALVAGVLTIGMGLYANFPIALAAGLGLNAIVGISLISQMTFADAMGLVVLEGILILILVLTGFRKAVFEAVPREIKTAISVGIGLFIALIGFVDGGLVRTTGVPAPPIQLGTSSIDPIPGWPALIFVIGLLTIIVLMVKKVKGAILIGIVGATILAIIVQSIAKVGSQTKDPHGWGLNVPAWPKSVVSTPDFSLFGNFSLFGAFTAKNVGVIAAVLIVFTLLLADFFDTMGTMTAIGAEAGLLDADGTPINAQRILVVDSVAAAAGGIGSVSSNTSYIESAAGVGEGARTGLASVITGICFLLATFLTPLVEVIPYEAATPALVVVGFLMMTQVKNLNWDRYDIAIPAFLTIVLMPFTYSITAGIGAGFISWVVIKIAQGKARSIHLLLWIVTVLFVAYFAIGPIRALFGVS
jgi:AGZA family xanthine/uracil permease-like MFS transporter